MKKNYSGYHKPNSKKYRVERGQEQYYRFLEMIKRAKENLISVTLDELKTRIEV